MTSDPSDLDSAIEWLYSTQMFGIKLGLENITRLLREGECFPSARSKVVQVVGTNGKGSTCAFLESLAQAHGLRTGLFTSPHLIHFRERIRVHGQEISDADLTLHLNFFRDLVADWDPHPTFFELSLAVALRQFLHHRCELIILEAGMGGRLDATSAVPKDLALITPIGMDHQQHLGNSLLEIAGEKGAVMRKDTPCVSAPQEGDVRKLLLQIAAETRCTIDFVTEPIRGLPLGLAGDHQAWNAHLAIEGLTSILGTGSLRYDSVKNGLERVKWKGRFEVIERSHGITVLDCAHNPQSAQALTAQWKSEFGDRSFHLVFGAAMDKNIPEVLRQLLPLAKSVEVYKLDNPRGELSEKLKMMVHEIAPDLECRELSDLSAHTQADHTLVTGSIFLVGEWLEIFST